MRRVGKILLVVFLMLFVLIAAFFIAVRYPAFQTYLAHRATAILSKSLDTKVSVDRVKISFFNKADLINFYLEDHHHDTLISAKELKVEFGIFELFNKNISVNKILIDGGALHLHQDSAAEEMNLTELFKSFKTNQSRPDTAKKQFAWKINLSELELKNTDFRFVDDKLHSDIKVLLPLCDITLHNLALDKGVVSIKKIQLNDADINIEMQKAEKNPADTNKEVHFLKGDFRILFDELVITNTRFRMSDRNSDTIRAKGIDFKHLDVSKINLLALNGKVIADTILADIRQLSAKERSGFELKNLITLARVSVNEITLNKLNLKTADSEVKNFLSFKYNSFRDFDDFMNAVRIKAKFDDTRFSLKDLNYFVRKLDPVEHNILSIEGEIDGRVNNLKGRGIEIRTGKNTIFKGDFYTKGLPNIYETSLNLRIARMATTVDDIKLIYPSLKIPENLNSLGLVYYTGSLDGFLTDFVSNGKLVTSIGSGSSDVNFKYDRKRNKAFYEGTLALNEFNLGKFFRDENNLGTVSLQTKINGAGLTLESLHAELNGNVSSIMLKGYDYRDIKVNGTVLNKSFNGTLKIKNEYLDMDFNGIADLTKNPPEFKFDANIQKAMLKNLNLTKDDIRLAGKIKSDLVGSKADDLIGSVDFNDITLTRDSVTAQIKSLSLDARFLENDKKTISLNADFAEGEISGNFTFKELPKALLAYANYTFSKDYTDTIGSSVPQNFTLDLKIYEPGNLTQIILPKLNVVRNTHIQGNFNSVDHQLNLTASAPEFSYDKFNIKRTGVNVRSAKGIVDFNMIIDKVYSNDSLILDTTNLVVKSVGSDFRFDLLFANRNRYNYANITAFITPQPNATLIRLEPSDVKLGNYNWHFDPGNIIRVEGKRITSNNLVFRSMNETVYIGSYLKNDTSTSIKLILDNTDIGDFTGIFAAKIKDLKGALNGKLIVEDIFYKPSVFADVVVNEFTLGNELIGDIDIESSLDEAGKNLKVFASVKSVNNNIEAKGMVSLEGAASIKVDVAAKRLGLNFLNFKFFDKYVKNCRGYAVANVSLTGPLKKPLLTGKCLLVNDTMTVSFLNTTYHLSNQTAILDEHGFDFGNLTLYDVSNNVVYGSGRINHESFRNFELDLDVTTPNAQFLNTTAKESPGFYGVAFGQGNVSFRGSVNSPDITAYAMAKRGTYCKLPVNSTLETGRYGFYKFATPGKEKTVKNVRPELKLNGVHFVLDLDATPDAQMDVILDPITGDRLTTFGTGNLKIEIPRAGNTTIYGNYEITSGNYLFTMLNIVNKSFVIYPGSTIRFGGDVYKAELNVDAVYELRSSVTDLIDDLLNTTQSGTQSQAVAAARIRVPVRLYLKVTDILEHPHIAFDIQVIDPDPSIKSYVDQKLALLKTNDAEMFKQVFGLLLMNRFLPAYNTVGSAIGNSTYVTSTSVNTVSEFLSSQLSNYLGNLLGYSGNNTLQNLDILINFKQYDEANNTSTTNFDTRRELALALNQRLLNNRLTINAGGNLDFGSSSVDSTGKPVAAAKSVIPTGDFQVEYALTPDGVWRAKAFNRTNYDYYNSRNTNKTGVGLSYRREFDKLKELFMRTGKKKNPEIKK